MNRSRPRAICQSACLLVSFTSAPPFAAARQTAAKPPEAKPAQSPPPKRTPEQQEIQRLTQEGSIEFDKSSQAGYEAALKPWEKALEKAREIKNDVYLEKSLSNVAAAYQRLKQYEKAIDYNKQALKVEQRLGDLGIVADRLTNIGIMYWTLGQYDAALEYLNPALQIREKRDNLDELSQSLNNIGVVYSSLNDYERAIEAQTRALEIKEKRGNPASIAITLNNIGISYNSSVQYEKAIEVHSRALQIREKLGDQNNIAQSLNNLSVVYNNLGRYEAARQELERAYTIWKKSGDQSNIADTLTNLGIAYKNLAQYQDALDRHKQALVIYEKLGSKSDIATSHTNLGVVHESLQEYDEAVSELEQAFTIYENLGSQDDMAVVLVNLGDVHYELGQPDKAVTELERALKIREKSGDQNEVATVLYNLGNIYAEQKRWDKADDALVRVRKRFETQSRQISAPTELADLQATFPYLYTASAYVLAQQNHPVEALALLEAGQARGIARQLFFNRSNYSQYFTKEEASNLKQRLSERNVANRLFDTAQRKLADCPADQRAFFQKRRDEYKKRYEEAERNYDRYRDYLFIHHPEFRRESGEQPVAPKDLLTLAQSNPDTLFLTWAIRDDKHADLYALGSQEKQTLRYFAIEHGARDFDKMASAWRDAINADDSGANTAGAAGTQTEPKQAKALYSALFAPLEQVGMLAKGRYKRLVIVASGPLLDIPFAALEDADGKRLIETYAVSSKVALNTAFWNPNPVAPKTGMLCVADPIGAAAPKNAKVALRRAGFGPLPEARREGAAVAELFHSYALIGPAARKADVLKALPTARLLHFATHGYLNAKQPFLSGLLLAPEPEGSGEDGVLSAREILDLSLSAQMAVLSACDTGSGVAKGGDGLQGLSWAFQAAGCPCVVASQWQVDDIATRELMLEFYKGLQAGQRKDDALRNAMRSVKEREPSPRYWAAFQIIGDAAPLKTETK